MDYLKVVPYEVREEKDLDGNTNYIVTFDNSTHMKLNKFAMSVIEKLDGKRSNKDVAFMVSNEINHIVSAEEIEYFIKNYLIPRNLIDGIEVEVKKEKQNSSLWFHKPLFESKRLSPLYDILEVLMKNRTVVISLLIASFTCVFLSLLKTINIKDGITSINTLLILVLVYFSMFFHELGHVTAAHKYKVEVGKIGVGIYLMYFLFFVDMTNVWKLDKKERVVTDFGGMYFQILTVIPLFIIYLFTSNFSLIISIMMIFLGTATNLMPFLRLDGYWLVSDMLGIQNVTINSGESILNLIEEIKIKIKDKSHKIPLTVKVYGIYSLVMAISTLIAIFFVINSSINIAYNFGYLKTEVAKMISNLIDLNFSEFFVLLNELFIYLIPIFFLINFVVKIISGIFSRFKNQNINTQTVKM